MIHLSHHYLLRSLDPGLQSGVKRGYVASTGYDPVCTGCRVTAGHKGDPPIGSLVAVAVTLLVSAPVSMFAVVIVTVLAIAGHVFIVVPIVAYEIYRPAAGMVLRAMFVPVLFMSRRDMQIDRLH